MRVILIIILLTGLLSCSEPVEQVEAANLRNGYSPVELDYVDETGERITVRLAKVRVSDDPQLRTQARERLDALVQSARDGLKLVSSGAETDRYERRLAHVYVDQGDNEIWLQEVLVREGWLIVSSFADNRARARELLEVEAEARTNRTGGWENDVYQVFPADPNTLAQHLDAFQIVEGRVIEVSPVINGQVFLNFGFDWRSDFTVTIPEDALPLFIEQDINLDTLEEREIRVRGWLQNQNGPMIWVDHPERIEILDTSDGVSLPE